MTWYDRVKLDTYPEMKISTSAISAKQNSRILSSNDLIWSSKTLHFSRNENIHICYFSKAEFPNILLFNFLFTSSRCWFLACKISITCSMVLELFCRYLWDWKTSEFMRYSFKRSGKILIDRSRISCFACGQRFITSFSFLVKAFCSTNDAYVWCHCTRFGLPSLNSSGWWSIAWVRSRQRLCICIRALASTVVASIIEHRFKIF